MRAGKSLTVSSADIGRLKSVAQNGNTAQKHVWRSEIVLLTADGVGTNENHETNREVQDLCLALAGTLH